MTTHQELTLHTLLYNAMRGLRSATLVGSPAPVVAALDKRISAPIPGDWVVETSTGIHSQRPDALGRLIAVRREPMEGEWEETEEEPRPLDTFWYIENVDGQLGRWWNCAFVAIPSGSTVDFMPRAKDVAEEAAEREEWVRDAILRHGLQEK